MKTSKSDSKQDKLGENFQSVKYFRNVKRKIAELLEGKSFKEQKELIRKVIAGEIQINSLK